MFVDKTEPECTWTGPKKGKAIAGFNVDELDDTTLTACQLTCEDNPECKSIDWKPLEKKCSLNSVGETDGELGTFANMEYFEKECPEGSCNRGLRY